MSTTIKEALRAAIEEGYLPEPCAQISDFEIVELLLYAVREYEDVIGQFLMMATKQRMTEGVKDASTSAPEAPIT